MIPFCPRCDSPMLEEEKDEISKGIGFIDYKCISCEYSKREVIH